MPKTSGYSPYHAFAKNSRTATVQNIAIAPAAKPREKMPVIDR